MDLIRLFYSNLSIITLIYLFSRSEAWSDSKKVKLNDVKTLTLYNGKSTTGRRSSPVPQLKCVGGSAGCYAFVPQVVQCYNQGSDGTDVQWECKTDMDNAYRFGHIQVTCEGYDYSEDPYVLKGSCGLEYTLELTKEGMHNRNHQGSHGYYGNAYPKESKKSPFTDALFFFIVCLLIYAIYRSCLRRQQYSTTDDDFDNPDNRHGSNMGFGSSYPSAPPPPGFRPGYSTDDSCAGTARRDTGSSGSGGFWTGAMAGSALGYLFGNRNNNTGYRTYSSPYSGASSSWGSSSSSGFSSGTRTASGYGGTSRR